MTRKNHPWSSWDSILGLTTSQESRLYLQSLDLEAQSRSWTFESWFSTWKLSVWSRCWKSQVSLLNRQRWSYRVFL